MNYRIAGPLAVGLVTGISTGNKVAGFSALLLSYASLYAVSKLTIYLSNRRTRSDQDDSNHHRNSIDRH